MQDAKQRLTQLAKYPPDLPCQGCQHWQTVRMSGTIQGAPRHWVYSGCRLQSQPETCGQRSKSDGLPSI